MTAQELADALGALALANPDARVHTHAGDEPARSGDPVFTRLAVLGSEVDRPFSLTEAGWQFDPDSGDWYVEIAEGCQSSDSVRAKP